MFNVILISEAILELVLLLLLVYRKSKTLKNKVFLFYVVGIIGWVFGIAMFRISSDVITAKIWVVIYYISAGVIATTLFQFSYLFPYRHSKFSRSLQIISFLPFVIFLLIIPTKIFIEKVTISEPNIVTLGPAYHFFGVWFIIYFLLLFFNLFRNYQRARGILKLQFKYLLIGTLMSGILGVTFNLILPWIGNYKLIQIGPSFSIIWLIFIVYAILKHKLLDIRIFVLRTVTYSIVVIIVSATVVGVIIFIPEYLKVDDSIKALAAVTIAGVIVSILDPLKRWIASATDKLFFKARVDYQKLSSELSEIINREIDLDILLFSLTHRLEKDLKIKNVSIYLAGSTGGAFYKRIGRVDKGGHKVSDQVFEQLTEEEKTDIANRIRHDNPLIKYLRSKQDIIVLEALERKIEDTQDEESRKILESSKASLDTLDAAVVAPVTVGNTINAVMVLGPKLSGDPFGSEDLNVLSLIGPQLASALEKSRLYEEAQQFTERLKKEVAVATGDLRNANMQLQERNRFLQALQKVTTLISRTLDFAKVTQSVVDSIASELGYLGGVLLLLGKDRHKLFPEAVTRTPLTEKALKLLPKPLNSYYGYFPEDDSYSVKAISTGKVQISEKLSDFISPAVPPLVAFGMQKLAGIKTVVGVPVYAENVIVGVINFMLQQEHGELKATDLDAMKALASQTGIVYRNIQLYKQIEESNVHLAEANVHLQQLDQAKSEFVSIASHQLRTPMTGIMGYLSMITQGDFGKVPNEQLKILQGLLEESQRMIRLINLFLNVSKIESGKMTLNQVPMQMEGLIEKVVNISKKAATDKGLKLIYKSQKEKLPPVFADADKLGDVIMNLVDNAIKYTDKGSVTVAQKLDGAFIETTVHDTGRGIDPEEAKKLFTKFVRGFGIAQVNPDGSGLGLYVARRLTEAHSGRIWVDSEGIGKGSTFHVRIPIYHEGMEEAVKKLADDEASSSLPAQE
ncbi:MAG: hypothetical protein HZC01_00200 [Candidatus Kerfeldbacteria bacterium]|nr:hypothetical protein [Candidatus Kerfeldbacteria bacterium]